MDNSTPNTLDPVLVWVLDHETTLRTHPQFTDASVEAIVAAMRTQFETQRVPLDRIGRMKAQTYHELTPGEFEAVAKAQAKRARRGVR